MTAWTIFWLSAACFVIGYLVGYTIGVWRQWQAEEQEAEQPRRGYPADGSET